VGVFAITDLVILRNYFRFLAAFFAFFLATFFAFFFAAMVVVEVKELLFVSVHYADLAYEP